MLRSVLPFRGIWRRTSCRSRTGSCAAAYSLPFALATAAACAGDGAATAALGDRGLGVTPASVACAVGERARLATTGGRSVEFVASNDNVRVSPGPAGAATLTCAAVGGAAVTVRDAGDGAGALTVPVRVARAPGAVLGVDVDPPSRALVPGEAWRLAARVRTRDSAVSSAARYRSLTPNVVTVDSAGGVVRAELAGEGAVAVRAAADPEAEVVVPVTVRRGSALVQGLFVLPPSATLVVGDTVRLTGVVSLTAEAPAGTSRAATFVSRDTAVAAVSADGLVLARRPGVARIDVAAAAAPALRTTATVTVREPVP